MDPATAPAHGCDVGGGGGGICVFGGGGRSRLGWRRGPRRPRWRLGLRTWRTDGGLWCSGARVRFVLGVPRPLEGPWEVARRPKPGVVGVGPERAEDAPSADTDAASSPVCPVLTLTPVYTLLRPEGLATAPACPVLTPTGPWTLLRPVVALVEVPRMFSIHWDRSPRGPCWRGQSARTALEVCSPEMVS